MIFLVPENNFRNPYNSLLKLSSIGIGTYLGESNSLDDLKVLCCIK